MSELWLADPGSRTLTCARAGAEGSITIGETEILSSDLLGGFTLDLARLF